jgi:hypothetical protein
VEALVAPPTLEQSARHKKHGLGSLDPEHPLIDYRLPSRSSTCVPPSTPKDGR